LTDRFLYDTVCRKYTAATKRKVLEAFFKAYITEMRVEKKAMIIRMLIIPMLIETEPRDFAKIFDHKCVDSMDRLVWQPLSGDKNPPDTVLLIELLQLTSLLLEYGPGQMAESKKVIIKFAVRALL
jgi:hypothetical protein